MGPKNIGSKKFWVKKMLGPKKFWDQMFLLSLNIIGPALFWPNIFYTHQIHLFKQIVKYINKLVYIIIIYGYTPVRVSPSLLFVLYFKSEGEAPPSPPNFQQLYLSSVVRFITSEHKRGPTEEDLTRSPEARLRVVLLDHTTILGFHCDYWSYAQFTISMY